MEQDGIGLTDSVATPSEVAGGVQVPLTTERYLYAFIVAGGLVIVKVAVVAPE